MYVYVYAPCRFRSKKFFRFSSSVSGFFCPFEFAPCKAWDGPPPSSSESSSSSSISSSPSWLLEAAALSRLAADRVLAAAVEVGDVGFALGLDCSRVRFVAEWLPPLFFAEDEDVVVVTLTESLLRLEPRLAVEPVVVAAAPAAAGAGAEAEADCDCDCD